MTYELTNENIEWMFNSPACRTEFFAGDAACAMGKLALVCLGEKAKTLGASLSDKPIYPFAAAFMSDFNTAYINKTKRHPQIIGLNDYIMGNFKDNHLKALRQAIQCGLECGFFTLETDRYAHEFYKLETATV